MSFKTTRAGLNRRMSDRELIESDSIPLIGRGWRNLAAKIDNAGNVLELFEVFAKQGYGPVFVAALCWTGHQMLQGETCDWRWYPGSLVREQEAAMDDEPRVRQDPRGYVAADYEYSKRCLRVAIAFRVNGSIV